MQIEIDEREHATILAALRCWQGRLMMVAPDYDMLDTIADNGGELDPLDGGEIGDLCERINAGLRWYCNIYLTDRAPGGPEEGGWWYDCGQPELPDTISPARRELIERIGAEEGFERKELAEALRDLLQPAIDEANGERLSDISSVNSEGCYVIEVETHPARAYPATRPQYE